MINKSLKLEGNTTNFNYSLEYINRDCPAKGSISLKIIQKTNSVLSTRVVFDYSFILDETIIQDILPVLISSDLYKIDLVLQDLALEQVKKNSEVLQKMYENGR